MYGEEFLFVRDPQSGNASFTVTTLVPTTDLKLPYRKNDEYKFKSSSSFDDVSAIKMSTLKCVAFSL